MRPRVRRSRNRTNYGVLDLFAGCGGLTEGLSTARHPAGRLLPIGAVELDRDAAATYAANFGGHVFNGDIADWLAQVPLADVVVGGPPCQGFSSLGRRDPDDPRNKLWAQYADAVAKAQPAYFVLENVVPFLRSHQFQQLRDATDPGGVLEGYTLDGSPGEVWAADFGAAQNRRRAVVVGRRHDMPVIDLSPHRREARTVKVAIGDLVARSTTTVDLPDSSATIRVGDRVVEVPGVFRTDDLHVGRSFTELSRRRFAAIPPGGNRMDLPAELQAPCWRDHRGGSHDVMGRLHWDRPSVTIRTEFWKPEKGRYLHPELDRPITHMEAARLQGFPDDFRWCGTKVSIGRQIGNAVPVPLGQAVGAALLVGLERVGWHPQGMS